MTVCLLPPSPLTGKNLPNSFRLDNNASSAQTCYMERHGTTSNKLICPILLNRRDAARMLSLSIRTLDYLIAAREIIVRRIGRKVLIPLRELERFARRDTPTIKKTSSAEVSDGV